MYTARPATRDSSPAAFQVGLLLSHYDRLPEMVYEMRDNLYTTPIKRERQRGKKREREKRVRGRWQKNEVSNRKVKECVVKVWRISRMSISREHGGSNTIVVFFFFFFKFFTLQQLEQLPSAALAPHSFLPTNEGCSVRGSCVDRLSHEIRIAIKFRG